MAKTEATLNDIESALYDISSEINNTADEWSGDCGWKVADSLYELKEATRRIADALEKIANK